jgi:hypothetical protein
LERGLMMRLMMGLMEGSRGWLMKRLGNR